MNSEEKHWSEYREQAAGYWQVKLLLICFKLLPMAVVRFLSHIVGFFYFIFSVSGRRESRRYLDRIAAVSGSKKRRSVLKHILAFAMIVVEKVEAWGGKVYLDRIHFQDDDITELIERLNGGGGAMLICSHLGSAELLRGLANFNRTGAARNVTVSSIVDSNVNAWFNRMLRELNPDSAAGIINADDVGPHTVIQLEEQVRAGGLVVIAGDRTSAHTREKYVEAEFLGVPAPFPYGAFLLAYLTKAPVYYVFAPRCSDLSLRSEYAMYVCKSKVSLEGPKKERDKKIGELVWEFSGLLETYCLRYPYQWYNFYDFWSSPGGTEC